MSTLFKKIGLIPFDDNPQKFNEAKNQYPILSTLSREYAISRTSITLFLISAIVSAIVCNWVLCVIFTLILVIYVFSCRKHALKIVWLMNATTTLVSHIAKN